MRARCVRASCQTCLSLDCPVQHYWRIGGGQTTRGQELASGGAIIHPVCERHRLSNAKTGDMLIPHSLCPEPHSLSETCGTGFAACARHTPTSAILPSCVRPCLRTAAILVARQRTSTNFPATFHILLAFYLPCTPPLPQHTPVQYSTSATYSVQSRAAICHGHCQKQASL